MTATYMYGGCASLKEYTMHYQDQFTFSLLTACLMQQSQMLEQQDAMLRELMDRVESVGDLLWRMERRHYIPAPVDQAGMRKRAAKARKKAAARKRSGK